MQDNFMKTVLITGADGFIGRNLQAALFRLDDVRVLTFDVKDNEADLKEFLQQADTIFHFAGVNRPESDDEFETGNAGSTQTIVSLLKEVGRIPSIIMTSSIQAELDNPYGLSKKHAEDILLQYNKDTAGQVHIYRLTNVFGKWCRPNYNSVVATFCYNISHGLDIQISDESRMMSLVYIDDIVSEFVNYIQDSRFNAGQQFCEIDKIYKITLGELAETIYRLRDIRTSLVVPDLSSDFMKAIHATYLSYLDEDNFSYSLDMKHDERGWLAELIKSESFGQIFISKTKPGITRGNHYHESKIEKFCVIQGEGIIRFRHIFHDEIINYRVSGEQIEIVDISPGYTHSIENISDQEMIVLFWANQIFVSDNSDTYYEEV